MSWLVVTVFSPRNDDPQFAVYEMNTLIQRADTEEQALEYAYDRACAFSAQFGHGTAALPVFQQCGTYHECNNEYSIGVTVVRPEARTAEVTSNGQNGSFDVLVDDVSVVTDWTDS